MSGANFLASSTLGIFALEWAVKNLANVRRAGFILLYIPGSLVFGAARSSSSAAKTRFESSQSTNDRC